jgi:hypothetical protein|tara:strand:+ start:516 stop:722 length:207 start_codon:yes stop_codon:yes gene_type:complete
MNDVFKYDNGISYEDNFSRWFAMNSKEKQNHKEKPYNRIVAKRIFNEQYGQKSLNKVVNKIKNLLKDK